MDDDDEDAEDPFGEYYGVGMQDDFNDGAAVCASPLAFD